MRSRDVEACSAALPTPSRCGCDAAAMGNVAGEGDVRNGRQAAMGGVVGQWRLRAPGHGIHCFLLGAHGVQEYAKLATRCCGVRWRAHSCSHGFGFFSFLSIFPQSFCICIHVFFFGAQSHFVTLQFATEEGRVYTSGLNDWGQLGLPLSTGYSMVCLNPFIA